MTRSILILAAVFAAMLFAVAGCGSSSPLAPTQSAIVLEKTFRVAVDATAAFPIERQRQLLPYEDEGNKILAALAERTQGFSKPLTVADFADVALQLVPDLAEIYSPTVKPSTRPAVVPSDVPPPPPPE